MKQLINPKTDLYEELKSYILEHMMKKMEELKNFELPFKDKIYLCQLFMVALWKKNVVIY